MKRLVIADDFSGAAEIAGLAHRARRSVTLLTDYPEDGLPDDGVVVVDTDSRLLSPDAARTRLKELGRRIAAWNPDRIYKKIDSVLRGPVLAEIEGLLDARIADRAVIASVNPSRERVVRNGRLFVGGVALDRTEFARDAFHPATCSEVRKIVGESEAVDLPDVESLSDLREIAATLHKGTLPVGGGDFYRVCEDIEPLRDERTWSPEAGPALWICGSRANRAGREALGRSDRTNVFHCDPDESVHRSSGAAIARLQAKEDCALMLPDAPFPEPDRLLGFFAEVSAQVVAGGMPGVVCIEGGATARSLVNQLGLSRFTVTGEVIQGIVGVQSGGGHNCPVLVVKPGSYPWPEGLLP